MPRYNLRYLVLEVIWVAVALGALRMCFVAGPSPAASSDVLFVLAMIAFVGSGGAIIGGLFGRMGRGAIVALALALVLYLGSGLLLYL